MTEKPAPLNIFYRLVLIASALFVITIFAMIANLMGDPEAPITSLIDRYAGIAMLVEFIAVMIFGFLAMAMERREIVKEQAKEEESKQEEPQSSSPSETESAE